MALSGGAEQVSALRAAIARLEASAPSQGGAGDRQISGPPIPLGSTGGCALDSILGGGMRRGALHEVAPATPRDEAAASSFALALAVRCLAVGDGVLVWIVADGAARESGAPYRPGVEGHGLDPDRLILVRTQGSSPTLWAAEEALRTRGTVVLAELWGGGYGLAPSRRLVLAARGCGTVGLVLHAGLPGGGTATLSSGGDVRFRVGARPSPRGASVGARLPVPGGASFAVALDKVRAAARGFDPLQTFPLVWDAGKRCFHDHDLPVALAPAPADRPAREAGWTG